jgi:hypothetical protein
MQRNFEPMRKQVEAWKGDAPSRRNPEAGHLAGLRGGAARCPKQLACGVQDQYFNPQVPEFAPRTLWRVQRPRPHPAVPGHREANVVS